MKGASKCFGIGVGVLLVLAGMGISKNVARKVGAGTLAGTHATGSGPRAVESYGKLPLSFEVNRGQTDARVRFLARGQGYGLFLTSQEAVLSLRRSEGREPRGEERTTNATSAVLHMQMVGANAKARVSGEEELPGKSNYFIGNDAKKWRTNIPTYAKVREENVYPGVDLVYYGNQGQMEYDFVVKPGVYPRAIKLALAASLSGERGQRSEKSDVKIAEDGDLAVQVDGGEVRFHKPVIYQLARLGDAQKTTDRIPVNGRYAIDDKNEVAFAVGEYDKTKALVIDPTLSYSTYLGGGGYAIAVDGSGSAFVTGKTEATNFPPTPTAFQQTNHAPSNGGNAFVTKFNADGSALIYSTYLGGSGSSWGGDVGSGIALDASGHAYVTGTTQSQDFPTMNAFQGAKGGGAIISNAFVTELSPDGSGLVYSTYLGGSGCNYNSNGDSASGIAVDGSGSAYIGGRTCSPDFPTANAFQASDNVPPIYGASTAFVTKFSPDGSTLVYSTYLGGSHNDAGTGIAVDSSGSAYITGYTSSIDFPTTPNAFQGTNHVTSTGSNTFVTKFNPQGSALVYSTYLGGSRGDSSTAIAVDGSGHAYVTGQSDSPDFPTTPGAFQTTNKDDDDAFVTEFTPDGSALVYSTYLGGSRGDSGDGIAVNDVGNAYVTGYTFSTDFPTAQPAQAANYSRPTAGGNAFAAELTPDGSALVYSTYLGGSRNDVGQAIAVDRSGGGASNAYITGWTTSTEFPTTPNAFQANGGAFVTKISPVTATADLAITNTAPGVAVSGTTLTYSIVVTNNGPDTATLVAIQDTIPAGTTFNSASVSGGSCWGPFPGPNTVTCRVFSLAPGASFTETLVVNVPGPALSTVADTATVSSAAFDLNTGDNSAAATTTVI